MKPLILGKWVVEVPAGKILVKEGEVVVFGQLIAKCREKKEITDPQISDKGWGHGEKEKWLALWVGKEVQAGEKLRERGGLFGGKPFLARECAKILGIDDFGNLVYEIEGEEIETISPVDGVARLPEKGRVVIEFRAHKIEGEGFGTGKTWGTAGSQRVVEKMTDISADLEGKVALISKVDELLLLKAGAVGVVGVVTREVAEGLESELPILKIAPKDWGGLVETWAKDKFYRCLLNATAGRLLVVESKGK